jgi:hypothetical protein
MEARKDGLERREGSNEFEPEPSREGMAQDSGIRERCTERGLGSGQEFDVCNNTAPVEGPVVTTTCPHTKRLVGGAVSGLVSNNPALRIRERANASNDNVRHEPPPTNRDSRSHSTDTGLANSPNARSAAKR